MKRFASAALVATTALATVAALPSTAYAGWSAGECNPGTSACLYYNSNQLGSFIGVEGTTNYTPDMVFLGGNGSGKWQQVKNNAASVRNMSPEFILVVHYNSNSNCSYACQSFAPGAKANFNSTMKNNNASQSWRVEV